MLYLNKTLFVLSLALGGVGMVSLAVPSSALADPSGKRVKAKSDKAMGEYDMMEFEAAKSLLMEAIALGERSDSKGPELATAYLNLGIVYFSGLGEEEKAGEAFASALGVDRTIELSVAYSTPEMSEMLETARGKLSASDGADCSVTGLSHELVDEAPSGSAPEMRAVLGPDVKATSVLVYYRGEGQLEFSKEVMKKTGDCEYVGSIPTRAVSGEFVHYYIAALDSDGKQLDHKGTSGSPNIIEVAAATGGSVTGDNDDPLGDGNNDGSLLGPKKDPRVFLSLAIGSGSGYISGPTEKRQSMLEEGSRFAPSWLHLMPEFGYFINKQFSITGAFRMGFPIGANVEGHATFAPAGLLRARYALSASGEGIQVVGAIGGGLIRNTVTLGDSPDPNMDTDTTVMGPILLGGGVGYGLSLGGPIRLVAEVNTLVAYAPAVDALSDVCGSECKTGAQVDANLAVLFAF